MPMWFKRCTILVVALVSLLSGSMTTGPFANASHQAPPNPQFAVARYNEDGSLDASFDANGTVLTRFSLSGIGEARAMAMDAHGKVVVAGFAEVFGSRQFALVRYNEDGSLDASFGSSGLVLTRFSLSTNAEANAIAIARSGKIVAAGFAEIFGGYRFAVACYNEDGSLDSGFGSSGMTLTSFNLSGDARAKAVAIDANSKPVVAGFAEVFGGRQFAVARYNEDGSLDASFGSNGMVLTSFGLNAQAEVNALVIDENGKLVAAGFAETNVSRFALVRYNPDGSLDASFGDGGIRVTSFGLSANAVASAMAIDEDGKLVVAGYTEGGLLGLVILRFAVVRYFDDGNLDQRFGGSGKVLTSFVGDAVANAVAVTGNRKIVAAGFAEEGGCCQFALARYNEDGNLDASFDADGRVVTRFGVEGGLFVRKSVARAIALDRNGKVVAAGFGDSED